MNEAIWTDVRRIVSDILQVPMTDVTPASTRDTLPAWDSMAQVNLALALEQRFDIQFLPEEMMEMLSVEIVALLVSEKLALKGNSGA